jgi:hypothetical protein
MSNPAGNAIYFGQETSCFPLIDPSQVRCVYLPASVGTTHQICAPSMRQRQPTTSYPSIPETLHSHIKMRSDRPFPALWLLSVNPSTPGPPLRPVLHYRLRNKLAVVSDKASKNCAAV